MKKIILIFVMLLLLCSCSIGITSSSSDIEKENNYKLLEPDFSVPVINNIKNVTLEDFFNVGNYVEINVEISQEELDKLYEDSLIYQANGWKSEVYRLASKVSISLTNYGNKFEWTFENVGIRQKGNTSRQLVYDAKKNMLMNHYKLSFDETFDDPNMYDSDFINKYGNNAYSNREFLGMTGLDFKWNKNYDLTHIKEIYASYLYRASGIMVQHIGLSSLNFKYGNKSISMGLCSVFEPASKSLIKRSLKSEDNYINFSDWNSEKAGSYGIINSNYGDLYKCNYGADLTRYSLSDNNVGVSNISGSYNPRYDRKTNTNIDYDDSLLRKLVNAITTSKYDKINECVDLEYLAISSAVGYFVGNPDDMRYNMNNYMIYIRKTDGKAVFIPIDNDRCFGIIKDWDPQNGMQYLQMLDTKMVDGNKTLSLLCDTILAKTENDSKALYLDYCELIARSKWVANETFETYYNIAKNTYKNYEFSLTDDNISFEQYILNKVAQINDTDLDIYFVSTINNWGNYDNSELSKYKLKQISKDVYQIEVVVSKVVRDEKGNYIKFKFNNGFTNYDQIDWTISSDLKTLDKSVGNSCRIDDVYIGDILNITINVSTLDVSVLVNNQKVN